MTSKGISEYQEEYNSAKKGSFKNNFTNYKACTKSYESQPVGGKKVDPAEVAKTLKRIRCTVCGKYCADANKDIEQQEETVCTSVPQLTVPDVHKLRYLTNNYVSAYDWY